MNKKNDMFAVLFYQPDTSVGELALNGITPDNTGIQDRDYYMSKMLSNLKQTESLTRQSSITFMIALLEFMILTQRMIGRNRFLKVLQKILMIEQIRLTQTLKILM